MGRCHRLCFLMYAQMVKLRACVVSDVEQISCSFGSCRPGQLFRRAPHANARCVWNTSRRGRF